VLKPTFATKSRLPTDTALIYLSYACYCSNIDNKNGLNWSLTACDTVFRAQHSSPLSIEIAHFSSICWDVPCYYGSPCVRNVSLTSTEPLYPREPLYSRVKCALIGSFDSSFGLRFRNDDEHTSNYWASTK
jgi:hypothetical protein